MEINRALANRPGLELQPPIGITSIGGGSINDSYKISSGKTAFFCKVNSATKFPHLFERERSGLKLIADQQLLLTPQVIDNFQENGQQFLLLEWINEGNPTKDFWKNFGEKLSLVHRVQSGSFGLSEDNYMGSIPQSNFPGHSWIEFFTRHRLEPMVQRCISQGLITAHQQSRFEKLYLRLDHWFDDLERPCLVHGDLWSGNFMCNDQDQPVLIDPAVYFGHRAVDLGMTTLFGGFPSLFYEAYHYHYPFHSAHKEQWQISNLYPLLVHVFLFGRSYLSQVESILKRFV